MLVMKKSDDGQLTSCQESITRHCSSLIQSTSCNLTATQNILEERLKGSVKKLRRGQLHSGHSHVVNQMKDFQSRNDSTSVYTSTESNEPLTFHSSKVPSTFSYTRDVLSGLQYHLESLSSYIDDDGNHTCSSSDDDDDQLDTIQHTKSKCDRHLKKDLIKQNWERERAKLGSQWAWLCHQITTLNQKLYQLESMIQTQTKESVQLTSSPLDIPCVCGLHNGHTDVIKRGNGSSTSNPLMKSGKGHINGTINPCPCQLRQMLLSNPSLLTHPLQVRDILGYSFPVFLMNESNQTCARTRSIHSMPSRKLIRMNKRHSVRNSHHHVDRSYHPYLSKQEDVPSCLWLDTALQEIIHDHPTYGSVPLVNRRRKGPIDSSISSSSVSSGDPSILNWPLLRLERSKSYSPSPVDTDRSKGIPRKRFSTTAAYDEPLTPTILSNKKRKGITTPQYDIDNIVIPYSILSSSTRLEKLEYKEIATPKWREVDGLCENGINNGVTEEEEDVSNDAIKIRHDRCELKERSRYLNFITGNRKRNGITQSTPESSSSPGTPPLRSELEEVVPLVLPWQPRQFPLTGKDKEMLKHPVPAPKKRVQYVPILDCVIPHSPPPPPPHLISPTPLVSPTTPTPLSEESPLWTVNATCIKTISCQPNIVIKLTKQTTL